VARVQLDVSLSENCVSSRDSSVHVLEVPPQESKVRNTIFNMSRSFYSFMMRVQLLDWSLKLYRVCVNVVCGHGKRALAMVVHSNHCVPDIYL